MQLSECVYTCHSHITGVALLVAVYVPLPPCVAGAAGGTEAGDELGAGRPGRDT